MSTSQWEWEEMWKAIREYDERMRDGAKKRDDHPHDQSGEGEEGTHPTYNG